MKLGIMQPYFFPYIGYWQLIRHVDRFVIFDDVKYTKRTWITRNSILINGQSRQIKVNVRKSSSNSRINEIRFSNYGHQRDKILKKIEMAYGRAPFFSEAYPVIESILDREEDSLSELLCHSLREISSYLGIDTDMVLSSEIDKDGQLKGQDKIIDICRILGASEYINPIGGTGLYSSQAFRDKNIELGFLKPSGAVYKQFNGDFTPNLSIIDLMMFNSREMLDDLLGDYEIIRKSKIQGG